MNAAMYFSFHSIPSPQGGKSMVQFGIGFRAKVQSPQGGDNLNAAMYFSFHSIPSPQGGEN